MYHPYTRIIVAYITSTWVKAIYSLTGYLDVRVMAFIQIVVTFDENINSSFENHLYRVQFTMKFDKKYIIIIKSIVF